MGDSDKIDQIHFGDSVILASDVAKLYGVETKVINQAVKNNPDKFPQGFIMEFSKEEKIELVKKFDRFNLKHSSAKVKGLLKRDYTCWQQF